jgi:hypothetical protein
MAPYELGIWARYLCSPVDLTGDGKATVKLYFHPFITICANTRWDGSESPQRGLLAVKSPRAVGALVLLRGGRPRPNSSPHTPTRLWTGALLELPSSLASGELSTPVLV